MYANLPPEAVESSIKSLYLAPDASASKPEETKSVVLHLREDVGSSHQTRAPVDAALPAPHDSQPPACTTSQPPAVEHAGGGTAHVPSEAAVTKPPAQQPLHSSHLISDRDSFSAPLPSASICELPDGTKVDLSDVERRLEAAAPILARAVVYHMPGHTYFVSMLALRTQSWQSVPSNAGMQPHLLLHEDVVAVIAARGSPATTTMEAKNDKCVESPCRCRKNVGLTRVAGL